MEEAKKNGARKAVELKTSGPFHTEKLKTAALKLREELDYIDINYNDRVKVIKNLNGKVYEKEDDVKEILSKHVMSPVRFSSSIETMLSLGADTFIEIGPRQNFI